MLSLFNTTIGMILALALLLIFLLAPIATVWIALSIRGSLARIANALESNAPRSTPALPERPEFNDAALERTFRRVANSAFGR
jgi:hypothetical protein